jgi:DNA-binding LacI/PurR family transcriptional regulator
MKKLRVTSKQVAERAGVSQTTVSFVLNRVEGQSISAETIERVQQAARELGYVPDTAARTLARGVSNNIGLILAQPHEQVFVDEYIPNVLTGIRQVIGTTDFRILVEIVNSDDTADIYFNMAQGREVAGLIITAYVAQLRDIRALKKLVQADFPIVTLGKMDEAIASVTIDDSNGTKLAIEHLIRLGHERIGVITFAPSNDGTVKRRLRAYRETLTAHNLKYDEALIRYGGYDPNTGYDVALELLKLSQHPTAIFCMNDVMAFGAMTAIQEQGLRIPDDIAVVGYDGIRLARYTTPSLTTIDAPDIERGHIAAQMLTDLIHNRPLAQKHIELETSLTIRDSCGFRKQQ